MQQATLLEIEEKLLTNTDRKLTDILNQRNHKSEFSGAALIDNDQSYNDRLNVLLRIAVNTYLNHYISLKSLIAQINPAKPLLITKAVQQMLEGGLLMSRENSLLRPHTGIRLSDLGHWMLDKIIQDHHDALQKKQGPIKPDIVFADSPLNGDYNTVSDRLILTGATCLTKTYVALNIVRQAALANRPVYWLHIGDYEQTGELFYRVADSAHRTHGLYINGMNVYTNVSPASVVQRNGLCLDIIDRNRLTSEEISNELEKRVVSVMTEISADQIINSAVNRENNKPLIIIDGIATLSELESSIMQGALLELMSRETSLVILEEGMTNIHHWKYYHRGFDHIDFDYPGLDDTHNNFVFIGEQGSIKHEVVVDYPNFEMDQPLLQPIIANEKSVDDNNVH